MVFQGVQVNCLRVGRLGPRVHWDSMKKITRKVERGTGWLQRIGLEVMVVEKVK